MAIKSELEALRKRMEEDKSLPLAESNLVFGEGNENAKLMFIGEAPGYFEDKEKRPFVGRAGQLLNSLITRKLFLKREDVYITNIVKRRPPQNRDPEEIEIKKYQPYLAEEIKIINPSIIAALGRFSMNYFLQNAKISRDHGKIFWLGQKIIMPLYHPAAALRSSSVLKDLELDFEKLKIVFDKFDILLEKKNNRLNSANLKNQNKLF
jgi:DNA polymerase